MTDLSKWGIMVQSSRPPAEEELEWELRPRLLLGLPPILKEVLPAMAPEPEGILDGEVSPNRSPLGPLPPPPTRAFLGRAAIPVAAAAAEVEDPTTGFPGPRAVWDEDSRPLRSPIWDR